MFLEFVTRIRWMGVTLYKLLINSASYSRSAAACCSSINPLPGTCLSDGAESTRRLSWGHVFQSSLTKDALCDQQPLTLPLSGFKVSLQCGWWICSEAAPRGCLNQQPYVPSDDRNLLLQFSSMLSIYFFHGDGNIVALFFVHISFKIKVTFF